MAGSDEGPATTVGVPFIAAVSRWVGATTGLGSVFTDNGERTTDNDPSCLLFPVCWSERCNPRPCLLRLLALRVLLQQQLVPLARRRRILQVVLRNLTLGQQRLHTQRASPDTACAKTRTAPPPRASSSHRAARAPARPAVRPPHSPPPEHERPPGPHGRSRDTRPSPACNPPACASPRESPPAPPARAPPAPTASAPPPSSPPVGLQPICHPERTLSERSESKGKSNEPAVFSPATRTRAAAQHIAATQLSAITHVAYRTHRICFPRDISLSV